MIEDGVAVRGCETGAGSTASSRDQDWSSAAGRTNKFMHGISTIYTHHKLFLYAIALKLLHVLKPTL
ncbi:hypothetical protein [Zooshikella harenae]|uniref:Uncharacterized protein n=1 Tax=Zooshikella harenae TaxID=2827238 RepID=A0ABS5ZIP2_9GAMM|nr:hypothetical protein [Zooshikella harenae]MBU2713947.1 hypothetical protein [Zooshikella harenae]